MNDDRGNDCFSTLQQFVVLGGIEVIRNFPNLAWNIYQSSVTGWKRAVMPRCLLGSRSVPGPG